MKSSAAAGATSITVSYSSVCKEGGLATQDVSGCFTAGGGDISVGGVSIGAPSAVTNSYRTLAGFSTAAEAKMTGQVYYDAYKAYFTDGDYAHQRVLAALDKTGICSACDDVARVEVAKKTSAYMNVWMYVIREFEDAIEDCTKGCLNCNDDPVHAWDEGVAFYAGSLEGPAGDGSGKLLHTLADKRCDNFGTCSAGAKKSAVNAALLEQFKLGRDKLLAGKCEDTIPIKKRVVELMSIPLVQGSLRYAYKTAELAGGSKEIAEGAAFSAAILGRVNACDAAAAKTIADNMNMELMQGDAANMMTAGFAAVKTALEGTYACLGITCEDVGGLLVTAGEYYDGAAPCTLTIPAYTAPASSSPEPTGGTCPEPIPDVIKVPTPTSKGSCYSMTTHKVTCNVAEADCGDNWYEPGYISARSGCCHCKASCPSDGQKDSCKYSDVPTDDDHDDHAHATTAAPDGDHDDHDDHDGHDHGSTTTAATVASASGHAQPTIALFLAALLLAQLGISHHA